MHSQHPRSLYIFAIINISKQNSSKFHSFESPEALGQQISRHILRRAVRELDHAFLHQLADKMVTDVHVLSSSVEQRVFCHGDARLVVFQDDDLPASPRYLPWKLLQKENLLRCRADRHVLTERGLLAAGPITWGRTQAKIRLDWINRNLYIMNEQWTWNHTWITTRGTEKKKYMAIQAVCNA